MRLKNVARFFNDDSIFDAYTDVFLFKAHTSPHDDHTSSGATSRRRTMKTIVGTVPPARRAVRIYDEFWVVGNSNTDGWKGSEIRRSYGLKKSTGLMELLTPGAASLGQLGLQFHAHKEYYKDTLDALTEGETDIMWNIFCPQTEPVYKGAFLRQGAALFRVRSIYPSVDEYLVAETDEFDSDAFQSVVFTTLGPVDLVTDTQPTISVATTVVQTDVPKYYQFRTEAENDRRPGDRTVFVAKSALTPLVSTTLQMQGKRWRVITVVSEGDSWALHVRLV